ncbi:MAG: hypothetical protein IPL50_05690 [Chitinophagaceae bacterium]|nr:hypothetical protein [Chitinophagaceae bacterium]
MATGITVGMVFCTGTVTFLLIGEAGFTAALGGTTFITAFFTTCFFADRRAVCAILFIVFFIDFLGAAFFTIFFTDLLGAAFFTIFFTDFLGAAFFTIFFTDLLGAAFFTIFFTDLLGAAFYLLAF